MSHDTWEWSPTLTSVIGWVFWFHSNKMIDPGIMNHWGSSLGEGTACPIQPNSWIDSPPSYPFYGQCWCHFLRIGCCRICSSLQDFRISPMAGALWKPFSPPVFGSSAPILLLSKFCREVHCDPTLTAAACQYPTREWNAISSLENGCWMSFICSKPFYFISCAPAGRPLLVFSWLNSKPSFYS